MKRITSIIIFLLFSSLLFAESAVLRNISGKVEISNNGSGNWAKATEGMVVNLSDTISTGFGAAATLDLGYSKIALKPLTRMSLDMFLATKNKVSTSLFLQVGSVKAEVDSSKGIKQSFQVQSPFSTASVRGTIFEFDGRRLSVLQGTVALFVGRPTRIIQRQITRQKEESEADDNAVTDDTVVLEELEKIVEQQQSEFDDKDAIMVAQGEAVQVVVSLTNQNVDNDDNKDDNDDNDETGDVVTDADNLAAESNVVADTSVVSSEPNSSGNGQEVPEVFIPEVTEQSQTDITINWKEARGVEDEN